MTTGDDNVNGKATEGGEENGQQEPWKSESTADGRRQKAEPGERRGIEIPPEPGYVAGHVPFDGLPDGDQGAVRVQVLRPR